MKLIPLVQEQKLLSNMNNKDKSLKENARQIRKAEHKISHNKDVEYWTKELETLQAERFMIEEEEHGNNSL